MPAPSFDELVTIGKAEQIIQRPELGMRPGDLSEMLIFAAAAMGDRGIGWFAERIAATFIDGASGDDLTQLVADHWGIQRLPATKSLGTVTFNRSGANATIQEFPIGTTIATERDSQGNDIQFVTTQVAKWAASTNGDRTVNIEAVLPGIEGNLSAANLITRIISTPPPGGTFTIVASAQPAGGSNEELDPELRDRAKLFPTTLRRGTLDALEFGARSITTISVAKANAISDSTGLTTVFVSDASGNSTGTTKEVNKSTVDDGTMTAKVAIELIKWAPAGSLVNVTGGAIQTVNISVTLAVKLGVDVAQLITDVTNSISARVGKLNIGDTLFLSDIITAVKAVDPDNIVNVVVTAPLVDTVPTTAGNIIRAGVITVS